MAGLALALQALSPSEVDGSAEVVRTVVPAPGEGGRLETRDGRVMRVSDPAALAAAINAQDVGVRVDFNHQSENKSQSGRACAEPASRPLREPIPHFPAEPEVPLPESAFHFLLNNTRGRQRPRTGRHLHNCPPGRSFLVDVLQVGS